MKVFVSWSGTRSRLIARELSAWLKDVFQGIETWMSEADIKAGARWADKLSEELQRSNFAVMCLTPENMGSPWMLFEAGAISRSVERGGVVPYCYQLGIAEVAFSSFPIPGSRRGPGGYLQIARIDKCGSTTHASRRPVDAHVRALVAGSGSAARRSFR